MADHVRKQIRRKVVDALQGLPLTEDRVYQSRLYPLQQGNLPGLLVFTLTEESAREESPTDSMRDLALIVQGVAALNDELDDVLDDIALQVETAIDNAGLLNGLAKIYGGIQSTVITLEAEDVAKQHGAIAMEFLYTYRTRSGQPDVAI